MAQAPSLEERYAMLAKEHHELRRAYTRRKAKNKEDAHVIQDLKRKLELHKANATTPCCTRCAAPLQIIICGQCKAEQA